jgi:hypothetical protein
MVNIGFVGISTLIVTVINEFCGIVGKPDIMTPFGL